MVATTWLDHRLCCSLRGKLRRPTKAQQTLNGTPATNKDIHFQIELRDARACANSWPGQRNGQTNATDGQ